MPAAASLVRPMAHDDPVGIPAKIAQPASTADQKASMHANRSRTAIALTAVALMSGAELARAQSSVTLFGVVDVNVGWIRNNTSSWQLGTNGLSTGRIGFRGIEDMGGGLKAGFWLEGEVDADTGSGSASYGNGDDSPFFFRRRSTVSLFDTWGEIRAGRDYTPTYWNWSVYDPFGAIGVGNSQNLAQDKELSAGTDGTYTTLTRANNMVSYVLPNGTTGAGLVGQLSVAAGEGAPDNKYFGGRIGFADGPYSVAASYAVTDVNSADSIKATVWNVGGSWDFGVVRVSGFYNQIDISGGRFAGSQQDNWLVGAVTALGQWDLKLSYGQAKGSGTVEGRGGSQIAVGGVYSLSKRTAFYATYSFIDNKPSTEFKVLGASPPLSPGQNSQGAQAGIRHSF